ncbi:MAG: DUF1464 family protein [bacterium]|nr:DUF1464 family protein [bacterium]
MKVIGIDPGTKGFSVFGMDGDKIFLDEMFSTQEIVSNMNKLVKIVTGYMPFDALVGPSGYGLPVTSINDASEEDFDIMLPRKSGKVPVNDAIKSFFYSAKKNKLPLYFTPGVIHLQTVPAYRKANKLDMGTADKLCCAALALEQCASRNKVPYSKCSFIFLEVGYGFTAAIGINNGKVVDGLGGTSGFAGFLSPGTIDAELAIRIKEQHQEVVFTGGAISQLTGKQTELEKIVKSKGVWETVIESAVKDVAALTVTTKPEEIIISGRLSRIPTVQKELKKRLSEYGKVFTLTRKAKNASEGAEGAVLLGRGLIGDKYADLVKSLELKKAKGTMYDYVTMKVEVNR